MNRIREYVDARGIKYSAIAKRLGLTRGTLVWKIDNNRFRPDQQVITAEVVFPDAPPEELDARVAELFPDEERFSPTGVQAEAHG